MSNYLIEIDDSKIAEQISSILNRILSEQLHDKFSGTQYEISQAVKELVYAHKDEIIQKCVDKASAELVRKGLPKLLERVGG